MSEEWIRLGTLKHTENHDLYRIEISKYWKGGWSLRIARFSTEGCEYFCDDEAELFDLIKKDLRLRDTQELEGIFMGADFLELRDHGRKLFNLRDHRKNRNATFSNAVDGDARRLLRSSDTSGKEIPAGHVHCPGCGRTFPSKRLLEDHKRASHPSLLR